MTSIRGAFDEMLSRIELNPTRVSLASQRYAAVKGVIEAAITGATVRQVGSFQRKTKIRPRDQSDALDVDAMVVLGEVKQYAPAGLGTSPDSALGMVERALRGNDRYRVMAPQKDSPVVVLEYSDDFKMEIAVGYREVSGKYPRARGPACYIVADHGNWKPADYDYDAEMITTLNQYSLVNEMLVPLIKLIKRWARNKDVPLTSFHLEILVANTVPSMLVEWNNRGWTWDYHLMIAGFLERSTATLLGPIALPNSYSPPVDSGLSLSDLTDVQRYFADRAATAWKLCKIDRFVDAVSAWQSFIGEPFPPPSGVL